MSNKLSKQLEQLYNRIMLSGASSVGAHEFRTVIDDIAALEARLSKMEEALDAAVSESIVKDATAASVRLVIRAALAGGE